MVSGKCEQWVRDRHPPPSPQCLDMLRIPDGYHPALQNLPKNLGQTPLRWCFHMDAHTRIVKGQQRSHIRQIRAASHGFKNDR